MSQPESKDEHKIATVSNAATDGAHGLAKLKKAEGSGSTHAGAIPKTSKDYPASTSKIRVDLVSTLDALHLTPSSSDENTTRRDRIYTKDSLESIPKTPDIIGSKSTSCTTSKDKCYIAESPHSESLIGNVKNTSSSSVSKVLAWDPWDKLSRKSKKENKRRKSDKCVEPAVASSSTGQKDTNRKDFKSGDEALRQQHENPAAAEGGYEEYSYQPYQKTIRSVEFTNKVMVVYINKEDKVVGEASEPLKKELEQQIRNKEMRRGHMPDVTFAKRNAMCAWFKK